MAENAMGYYYPPASNLLAAPTPSNQFSK